MSDIRNQARREIVNAANDARDPGLGTPLLSMRQVQRAVFRCRQRQLVPEGLLRAAGFAGRRR